MSLKIAGLFAGLLLGSALLISVSWVWIRHQKVGVGGLGLLTTGTIIVILSLGAFGDWNLVTVETTGSNIAIRLEQQIPKIVKEIKKEIEKDPEVPKIDINNTLTILNSVVEYFGANEQLSTIIYRITSTRPYFPPPLCIKGRPLPTNWEFAEKSSDAFLREVLKIDYSEYKKVCEQKLKAEAVYLKLTEPN